MFRPRIYTRPLRSLFQPRIQQRTAKRGRAPQQYQKFGGGRSIGSTPLERWAARPTFFRDVGIITAGCAVFYVVNLEEVPVSGRRRFNIISPSLEVWLAESALKETMETYRGLLLPDYDSRVRRVKTVLQRLLPYARGVGLEGVDWEVHVIDDPEEQNAFVLPGGKVFVFTGMLSLCDHDDSLAAILGHEIAHVVAHHQAESMSRAPLLLFGIAALASVDFSLASSKYLIDIFLSLPSSRKQETEADYIGLMMMAEGCYRPEAAVELWQLMESLGGRSVPRLLSTHPSNGDRRDKITEWLPKANQKRDNSECHGMIGYVDQFTAAFQRERW